MYRRKSLKLVNFAKLNSKIIPNTEFNFITAK
jgi:hypothetical protein